MKTCRVRHDGELRPLIGAMRTQYAKNEVIPDMLRPLIGAMRTIKKQKHWSVLEHGCDPS